MPFSLLSPPAPDYIDNYYTRTLSGVEQAYPALTATLDVDVCVVGGGLAGLNTALGLVERGKSVALLEEKRIGWGASGRNGGFVAKGYAAEESALFKRLGLAHTQRLMAVNKQAHALIRKRIAGYAIDCGPLHEGVLIVSMHDREAAICAEVAHANEHFNSGLIYQAPEQVRALCKTKAYYQGYLSPHDFQFHPLRYVHGLARVLAGKGGVLHEHTPATRVERGDAGWVVTTPGGRVRAEHVVLCCSVYSKGLSRKLENAVFPVQTYITVTKPLAEEALQASVASPYPVYELRFASNYYRVLPDQRILWGGRVGLWAEPHDIARAQMGDLLKIYPQLKDVVEPELAWSGLMAYAPHKMPQIGQLEPGYWYNTGFGGHGLIPTTVGGEIIAGAIAHGETEKIELFRPFGVGYAGGHMGRYVAQLVYWLWRARDYVTISGGG